MTSLTNPFPQFFLAIWTPLFSSFWINLSPTDSNGNAFEITVQNRQFLLVTTWLIVLSRTRDMSSHHVKGWRGTEPEFPLTESDQETKLSHICLEGALSSFLFLVPPILLESPPSISPEGETVTAPFCRNNFSVILFLIHLLICKSQKAWKPS